MFTLALAFFAAIDIVIFSFNLFPPFMGFLAQNIWLHQQIQSAFFSVSVARVYRPLKSECQ